MATRPRCILVDGSSLIYRAFFALPSNFSTREGLPTNAIYGFATMFRKILSGRTPEYGAVLLDAPGPSLRAERYPDYKAQRPPMDPRLRLQIEHIDAVIDAHGFRRLRMPGYEADDLIGTLCRMAVEAGAEVQIISGDKDFAQLIGPQVRMIDSLRDITFDEELVRKKFGVAPEHFVDWLAMAGDKVDNIPGVPGIGGKGAAKLLQEFGSLDALLQLPEGLGSRHRALLEAHADSARLSQELATIDRKVPVELGLGDLALEIPDASSLNEVYRRYEFNSLLGEEERDEGADKGEGEPPWIITSLDEVYELEAELRAAQGPALVPVMDAESAAYGSLAGFAFAWAEDGMAYLPIDGSDGLGDDAIACLAQWFEDEAAPKLCYDAKRSFMQLKRRQRPLELHGVVGDVQLESFLVEPTKIIPHALEEICKEYLQRTLTARKRVTGSGKSQRPISEVDVESVAAWACRCASTVRELAPILRTKLEEVGLVEHLFEVDLPLAWTLGRMELAGILVDPDDLAAMGEEFAARLRDYELEIYEHAGREFNIRSTKQLSAVLFDELGLPVIKRTKSGYSTNAEVLERLKPHHPIAVALLAHRKLTKLINTYTDVLQEAVQPRSGRIHSVFQQTTGATGRLISTDPDLQRTPIKTPEGARIRQAFVAPPGHLLVAADWSQIELRLLAHVTSDSSLVEAFVAGDDVHRRTASQIFSCAPGDVDKARRDVGKLVNFATIYGQGATALGQIIGVKRAEAQSYIDGYFAAYAGVRRWLDETIAEAHARGYVTTLAGRRRYIPELSSRGFMERQAGERIAANTPIQGSAADLCKQAMLDIDLAIRERGLRARMLLQIHDELVFEVPEDELEELVDLVSEGMEQVAELLVPLVADVGVGKTWRAAKENPIPR
jgi:DNA polymerase-1